MRTVKLVPESENARPGEPKTLRDEHGPVECFMDWKRSCGPSCAAYFTRGPGAVDGAQTLAGCLALPSIPYIGELGTDAGPIKG